MIKDRYGVGSAVYAGFLMVLFLLIFASLVFLQSTVMNSFTANQAALVATHAAVDYIDQYASGDTIHSIEGDSALLANANALATNAMASLGGSGTATCHVSSSSGGQLLVTCTVSYEMSHQYASFGAAFGQLSPITASQTEVATSAGHG